MSISSWNTADPRPKATKEVSLGEIISPKSVNSKQQIIKNWFSDVSSVSSRILGLDSLTMNVIIISDFQVSHDEGLKYRFSESVIKKLPVG